MSDIWDIADSASRPDRSRSYATMALGKANMSIEDLRELSRRTGGSVTGNRPRWVAARLYCL
jgi:hypothetical protein